MDSGSIPSLIVSQLEDNGYEISYDEFYLNSIILNEPDEIDTMSRHLRALAADGKTDLIVILNDQAAYSALKTYDEIFDSTPTILLNIHFPSLLRKRGREHIYYCVAGGEIIIVRNAD